jgi:ABC-type transport system substrate-binding protein
VFFGLFEPASGVFHADSWVGDADLTPYKFDLRHAGALLDEAGWRRDPQDGWRYQTIESADGPQRRLRAAFVLNLPQGSQTAPAIADIYQQDLRKLGVDMTSRVLEWAVFNERNFNGTFEAYLSAWTPGPDPDDAWNLFHSSEVHGGRNYTGYASGTADALLASGRAEFDPQVRRAAYQQFARLMYTDAPYTFLVSAPTLWAFERNLRGVQISPRGPSLFYPGVCGWWRER